MDPNTVNPQTPTAQAVVNQQVMPPATPPRSPQFKKLIMILGAVVLVIVIAGIGIKLLPANTKQNTSTIKPTKKLGFQDLMRSITKTPDTINTAPIMPSNTNRPIILVKNQKIVAIDLTNTTKENVIYEIKHGTFTSAELSPDGKQLAYAIYYGYERALPPTASPVLTKCGELGVISIVEKQPAIVYSDDKACGDLDDIIEYKHYGWMDSSTLLYYNKDAEKKLNLFQYDIHTNKSSAKTTIRIANLPWSIRGKNVYFQVDRGSDNSRKTLGKVSIENPDKIEELFDVSDPNMEGRSVSPDEKYAVYGTGVPDYSVVFRELNGTILKRHVEPGTYLTAGVGDRIVFSPDSKYVAVGSAANDKNLSYLISDSSGNKIGEIYEQQFINVMPGLPDNVRLNGYVSNFSYSPNSKKIFFVFTFSVFYNKTQSYTSDQGYSTSGFYAFMGDADGKNLKRAPLAVDGIKSYKSGDSISEKEYKEFSNNSIVDVDW